MRFWLGPDGCSAELTVEARAKYTAHNSENGEISSGRYHDLALGWIGRLEDDVAATVGVDLHCSFFADASRDDILVFCLRARIDHHIIALADAAADHAVAFH